MRNRTRMIRQVGPWNRTRTLFFAFIAIMLAVLAWSLATQLIDSVILRQVYIAASILAVGVILFDILGLLGEQHGEDGASTDHGEGGHGHGDSDVEAGGSDAGDGHGVDDGMMDMNYSDGDDAIGSHHANDVDHHLIPSGRAPVLEAIRYLRMFVYFCLGFGLMGLTLLVVGGAPQTSLFGAGAAGIGTVFLARTFYRLQPKDTGDVLSDSDLLMEKATVTIPLTHETMGRVRVTVGIEVRDLYAKAAHEDERCARGDTVRIIEVTDECVYVEQA